MKHAIKGDPRISTRWHSDSTKPSTSTTTSTTTSTSPPSSSSSSRWNAPVSPTEVEEEKERQRLQSERENAAVVATQVGALANVGLAGTKGVIGYGVNSTALMADAGT